MTPSRSPEPSCAELFRGFLMVGLCGFGGVMPWLRRVLVDDHRWLDDLQFTQLLSLAQPLPGPNSLNMAIMVGDRFQGLRGSVAAGLGLLLAPLVIVLTLATLFDRYGRYGPLKLILAGVSAAAAGLVLGTGLRLLAKLERRLWVACLSGIAFLAVAFGHQSVPLVLLALAPIGVAFGHFDRPAGTR